MKDLNYYVIMYGGCPMTLAGAKRFLVTAQQARHSFKDCLSYIPDELLSQSGLKQKQG